MSDEEDLVKRTIGMLDSTQKKASFQEKLRFAQWLTQVSIENKINPKEVLNRFKQAKGLIENE